MNLPALLPIRSATRSSPIDGQQPGSSRASAPCQQSSISNAHSDEQEAHILQAQITMNTKLIAEIEKLRKQQDQSAKENQVLRVKLTQMNEQLTYLKKKITEKDADLRLNKKDGDENSDPNAI